MQPRKRFTLVRIAMTGARVTRAVGKMNDESHDIGERELVLVPLERFQSYCIWYPQC